MNKNFMYGIGAVKYKDFTIGYIEKNSFDLGGKKPEAAKIEAEQVQGAPVLVIPQSNGGIAPTFNVIQMNYSNLHKLLGGSLHYKKEDSEKKTPIGWTAPSEVLVMQGPWELSLVSGQSVLIPNATLLSNPAGKLTLTETSKIEVTLKVAMRRTVRSLTACSIRKQYRTSGGSTSCRRRKPRLQHRSKVRRANVWLTVWNN